MRGSLPHLDEIYEKYAAQRDKFVIVALCTDFVDSFDKYQPKADQLVKTGVWKRDLPFPVILDPKQGTWKAWAFIRQPFQVLIDPDGNLAAYGSGTPAKLLEEKLQASGNR